MIGAGAVTECHIDAAIAREIDEVVTRRQPKIDRRMARAEAVEARCQPFSGERGDGAHHEDRALRSARPPRRVERSGEAIEELAQDGSERSTLCRRCDGTVRSLEEQRPE